MQTIPDVDERHKRLVELNVQESCINLFANPIVQKKQATSSQPKIHGWVYDVATGLLKKLDIDFKVCSMYHAPRLILRSPRFPLSLGRPYPTSHFTTLPCDATYHFYLCVFGLPRFGLLVYVVHFQFVRLRVFSRPSTSFTDLCPNKSNIFLK